MVVKAAVSDFEFILVGIETELVLQMLGNLKAPPDPFADVIRTHFKLKARSITEQLDEWLRADDGKPTLGDGGMSGSRSEGGSGFNKDVEEMKKLLKELEKESL